jgi:hypothetical protein
MGAHRLRQAWSTNPALWPGFVREGAPKMAMGVPIQRVSSMNSPAKTTLIRAANEAGCPRQGIGPRRWNVHAALGRHHGAAGRG